MSNLLKIGTATAAFAAIEAFNYANSSVDSVSEYAPGAAARLATIAAVIALNNYFDTGSSHIVQGLEAFGGTATVACLTPVCIEATPQFMAVAQTILAASAVDLLFEDYSM